LILIGAVLDYRVIMQRRSSLQHCRSIVQVLALVASCFCVPAFAAPAKTISVEDIRLWAGPDGTRVVFDLSGPARYTVNTVRSPDRVVIDIPNARLAKSERELPDGQGFVKQLRIGRPKSGALQVVVDLSSAATADSFAVGPSGDYGHRLVVDLGKPGAAQSSAGSAPVAVKSVPVAARDIVIAVDAGHGGNDPGSIGKRGTYEKDVTLAIARRLKERIDKEPGMRAVLTRDGDYFVVHRDRMARARKQQADMFISVHADAVLDRSVTGSSVYTLSMRGASDESARWLAHRENSSDLVGGVSLEDRDSVLASVLLDLSQGASMTASADAAARVLQELDRVGVVRRHAVQNAGFLVLKSPDIPSMLVETAFISNPGEELKLTDAAYQTKLADAIQAGVRGYFMGNPPPGTRFAEMRARKDGATVVAQSEPTVTAGGSR
jgi:N-acetylmuramoyl-L-alanine amidase